MTAERHMVTIETERTGRIELTPDQFDILLECAMIGLDGAPYEGDQASDADAVHAKIMVAYDQHTAKA